jgi:hypothetical protein
VQVVVQQSGESQAAFCGQVVGGQSPGVVRDEVMEAVAAWGVFVDQVVAVYLIQETAGGREAGVIERGSRIIVD